MEIHPHSGRPMRRRTTKFTIPDGNEISDDPEKKFEESGKTKRGAQTPHQPLPLVRALSRYLCPWSIYQSLAKRRRRVTAKTNRTEMVRKALAGDGTKGEELPIANGNQRLPGART